MPGVSVVVAKVIASAIFGSFTSTLSIVTLPVLVIVNVYSTVWPSADSMPVFTSESDGLAGTSTSVGIPGSPGVPGLSGSGVDGTGAIGWPGSSGSAGSNGGVPVTVAAFSTTPASFSGCVIVYVACSSTDSPGANTPSLEGQVPVLLSTVPPGSLTSLASIPVSVTLPVLVTVNVYSMVLPSARSEEHTSELQSRENLVC